MMPDNTTAAIQTSTPPTEILFTVSRANAALVLVQRIVADLVHSYRDLLELKRHREALAHTPASFEQGEDIQNRVERCVADLNRLHQELVEIGCVLKDWSTGLADFPALYQGRRVWLCWRLGESAVTHWHEVHEGFARRKPITDEFADDRQVA
jgi:hypothetical protein